MKDATLALLRLNHNGEIRSKVYVRGFGYYLEVNFPDELTGNVEGVLAMGQELFSSELPDAEDCTEFYQGEGLTKFRGV